MKRRDFIALTTAFPLAAVAQPAPSVDPAAPAPSAPVPKRLPPQVQPLPEIPGPTCLRAGPMLGHVGESEAWIWIKATGATPWSVEVSETPDFEAPLKLQGLPATAASDFTAGARVVDLKPAARYFYRVSFGERLVSGLPAASFQTAPVAGTAGFSRIAFGSCVGRLPEQAGGTWGEMSGRANFDLLLMLGDNHYGDTTELERQRLNYTAHRVHPAFRDLTARKPVYAIWDDHDYGPNDSDGGAAGKERSLQAFREFWLNPPRLEEPADPAIYYTFQRGDVGFFMLDVRWHRSPNAAPDGPDKTMLGAAQLAWLKQSLKASRAAVKIIASGSEWQTNGHKDSWSRFARERDGLLEWMAAEGIAGVVFVSGDRHFSAGYQILGKWVELTSGPLGSPVENNPKAVVSPESFTLRCSGRMWMVLEIDTRDGTPSLAYEIWGAGAGMLERRALPWEAVLGREPLAPSELVVETRAIAAKG